MSINIERRPNMTQDTAVAEMESCGFAAEVKDYGPGETQPHQHDYDVSLYVIEGELKLSQPEGPVHRCQVGDWVHVARGTRHAEQHEALRMVVGRRGEARPS